VSDEEVMGAAIHPEHPFAAPADARDPARQLRGRLVAPVTVWTAGKSGLTVSSVLMAAGEPAVVCGLLDPDSDFADALEDGGRAVINILRWRHRTIADVFAGLHPSPGGQFRTGDWTTGPVGPVLADAAGVAVATVLERRPAGWSSLVTASIDEIQLPDDADEDMLAYARGRYRTVTSVRGG
jgi:flavin reductase (DIM6/NTAB) family NADH-FMN oxidoreductase RutF